MQIAGSIAVVTGASEGIGKAIGLDLALRGATVVGIARRMELLEAAVEEFRRHAPESLAHRADVSSRADCEEAIAAAERRFGRVDIVVNNAGLSIRKPAIETSVDEIERVMQVNFLGAVSTTMAALPGMLARKRGSVVNITSVAGYLPNPKEAAYCASKAALSLWSHTLAVELHGTGVHVGVVSPGPIQTEIWGKDETPAAYAGKMYPPTVVADAVARSIEREKVHTTVPRKFGLPAVWYALFPEMMRRGIRKYDEKAMKRLEAGSA
jgi:hypothetical protein